MIFLILLFLLLPSQLAFHFWPSWSLINGIRIDYLSPALYLTDLTIFGLFLTSRLRIRVPVPIIIFVVLNTLNSTLPLLTLYKWFRVLEYFWLFKYLTLKIDLKLKIKNLKFAVLWTSILAWWQFFLQHSVGGLWYWLGERPLSVGTPGIAKISINWIFDIEHWTFGLVMRPYATSPHPNALAGFLLVGGLILYSFYTSPLRPSPIIGEGSRGRGIGLLALIIAFLTIPLTFSRTAIILEILILVIWILVRITREARAKARCLKLKITSLIMLIISSIYFLISITGSAVSSSDRLSLIHNSFLLIQKSPLFGIGLGAFIPSTMNYELITNNYLYQPVHNIYLLLASELGLPALFVIGYFVIINSLKIKNLKLKIALGVVLATGALDHYWLTLHQNILLLVILIAYAYSYRWGSQR